MEKVKGVGTSFMCVFDVKERSKVCVSFIIVFNKSIDCASQRHKSVRKLRVRLYLCARVTLQIPHIKI